MRFISDIVQCSTTLNNRRGFSFSFPRCVDNDQHIRAVFRDSPRCNEDNTENSFFMSYDRYVGERQ